MKGLQLDRNAKMLGIPKSLVIWVPPSKMFVSYQFFNSGSQIRPKIKRQSKLSTTKGLEGRGKVQEMRKNKGYPNP